ncbi:uncharacterized protein [Dysidea avara]|uniref:uncharacterized protein n=1 Tax=Dysidea avara TaxID=196820 RepID=UPI00331947B4
MLKLTASEDSRRILETGLKDYGLRRKPVAEARRISGARKGSAQGGGQLAGAKMWSSMGDMLEGEDETDDKKKKKVRNTSILRRFSMRKEKRKAYLSEIYESGDQTDSPSLDRRKQNRNRVQSEMISYAV